MKLTFLGAAGEVTGSQHLIETDALRLLLDCGLFQGHRATARSKNERFHCDPRRLDGLILSHAHIDHCGNIPGLYRAGFRGPIFCTPAAADVAEVMLEDSARIQEEDVRYLRKHLKRGHPPIDPLYTNQDVSKVLRLFEPLEYGEWHDLSSRFRLRFVDAGHILGSAICEMEVPDQGEQKRVVFTGDLGRRGLPLLRDPQPVGGCDVLITESTYGDRVHPAPEDMKSELLRIVKEAVTMGGKVLIPAFSLGRTQTVVYYLNQLVNEGELPAVPVFVDSPLSRRLTAVYRDYTHILDDEVQRMLRTDSDPFGFQGLTYIASQQESISLNRRQGSFIVIAASGMCENGRILHHLKHSVTDSDNTILLIGFQAAHTLGRRIVERQPTVKIFGRQYPLRAHVEKINGLSAHADALDFKWWFERLSSDTGIGQAFVVHGESQAAQALSTLLRDHCDEDPIIPQLGDSYTV